MPNYGTYSYGQGEYGGPPVFTQAGLETAGGLFPKRIVEVAFGNGPNDTNPTWVDITSDVTDIQTQRGRQHTLGRFEAGTMKVTVDNKSGKYSPFNSSGPYYGNIRPGMPIRWRNIWGGNSYMAYYGFVESWPLAWPAANDSTVTVSAVDAMKFLNLKRPTAIATYPSMVTADTPYLYFHCDDAGPTLSDSVGTGTTLTPYFATGWPFYVGQPATAIFNPTFQVDGVLVAETSGAVDLSTGTAVFWGTLPATISRTGTYAFEVWAKINQTPKGAGSTSDTLAGYSTIAGLNIGIGGNHHAVLVDSHGMAQQSMGLPGDGSYAPPTVRIDDDKWHHLAISFSGTVSSFYVDGVLMNSVATNAPFDLTTVELGGTMSSFPTPAGFLGGTVDEFAIYQHTLTATQIANHYTAGVAPRVNETTGQRIAYLAGYTGIPAAQQKIDIGNTTVQGATDDWLKNTILRSMQDQADSENGDLFIDAAGNLCFFDRYHTSHSPYSSVMIVLGDSGAPPEEPYRLDGVSVPYDDQDVWNEIVVTPAGLAAQTASDTTSWQQYGRRTKSIGTLSNSVGEAANRAAWELNLNKASAPRIDSVVIVPTDDPTMLFGPVLGADVLSRVELRRRPMDGTNSMFDQTALIEGIEHRVGKASWQTTWRLSYIDATIIWIIDDPVAGKIVDGALQPSPVVIGY